jgi:hypothetical protein
VPTDDTSIQPHVRRTLSLLGITLGALWFALSAPPAFAGETILVIGAGDCKDSGLLGAVSDAQDVARSLVKDDLFEGETVLDKVRPHPKKSFDALLRQLKTAREALFEGRAKTALDLAEDVLVGLKYAAPQGKVWSATTEALLMSAEALHSLDREKDAETALWRIARLAPDTSVSADLWSPGTISALDSAKAKARKSTKSVLEVVSSGAASVFVDGKEVGETPLKFKLPAGTYRLSLVSAGVPSFPRLVTLPSKGPFRIDMVFEGSLSTQTPLCLSGDDTWATRLASTVGAARILILRNGPRDSGRLVGALWDAQRGTRLASATAVADQLRDLVSHLLTGKPGLAALTSPAASGAPGAVAESSSSTPPPATPAPTDGKVARGAAGAQESASKSGTRTEKGKKDEEKTDVLAPELAKCVWDNHFANYARSEGAVLLRVVDRSSPTVASATEQVENGLATANCYLVNMGLERLKRVAKSRQPKD